MPKNKKVAVRKHPMNKKDLHAAIDRLSGKSATAFLPVNDETFIKCSTAIANIAHRSYRDSRPLRLPSGTLPLLP